MSDKNLTGALATIPAVVTHIFARLLNHFIRIQGHYFTRGHCFLILCPLQLTEIILLPDLKRSNTPSNNAHLLGRAELLVLHVVLGVGSVFQTHIQRTLTSSALLTVVFVCRGCVCRISAALKVNLTMPFLTVLCMLRRLREYAVALKYALTTQYS